MAYQTLATYYFDKKFKKLTKKDGLLKERIIRKLQEISINPDIGEPKRYVLKGLWSEHLDPFVIIYIVIKDIILLINFDHHDKAYAETPKIIDVLLTDFSHNRISRKRGNHAGRVCSLLEIIW